MVSVIIPTYNRSHKITQAIDSVLAQTYPDYEIVVVDDGSTDATEVVLSSYISEKKIIYHKQMNAGVAGARNRGVNEAHGEFVAFLDSDDEWLPNKLSEQLKLFKEKGDQVLVYANIEYWNRNKEKIGELFYEKTIPHAGMVIKELLFDNFVSTSSVILRKELFLKAGGFDQKKNLRVGEDYDLWLRIASIAEFYYVTIPLVRYYVHDDQVTGQKVVVYWNMMRFFTILFFMKRRFPQIKKSTILMAIILRIIKMFKRTHANTTRMRVSAF